MPNKRKWKPFWPPLWWQYIRSDSDFLLRIGPLSKHQIKETPKNHYPPPGYGLSPGQLKEKNKFSPRAKYGLFLFPGKIAWSFILFSALLPLFMFSPFLTHQPSPYYYGFVLYIPATLLFWGISFWAYYRTYYKIMPPVLSNAWEKWPPTAYHLFLSVPHKIFLKKPDRDKEEYLYWQPDVRSNMSRQTTVFAKNTQSLQEVILNFAIFEFFFPRPKKKKPTKDEQSQSNPHENDINKMEYKKNAINDKNWFKYLFAPIWISYLLILLFLMLMALIPVKETGSESGSWIVIANLPYNFLPVIVIWFLLTLRYIQHIITDLENLHDKVRKGVFDSHLERVPQAILQELANIPKEQHINEGIQYIKRSMGWLSSIALLGFLGLLEVLSQGYGSQAMDFCFY